ncbi:MAG: hypothetical protein JO211_04820, partial [Acidobacteriaceae bacterium]|nr:hypothetical protein [Acidobacteriaceae bacterium]
ITPFICNPLTGFFHIAIAQTKPLTKAAQLLSSFFHRFTGVPGLQDTELTATATLARKRVLVPFSEQFQMRLAIHYLQIHARRPF